MKDVTDTKRTLLARLAIAREQGHALAAKLAEVETERDQANLERAANIVMLNEDAEVMEQAAAKINALKARTEAAETALATARRDALEEAAKVADGFHDAAMKWAEVYCKGFDGETDSQRIAKNIRALTTEGKDNG